MGKIFRSTTMVVPGPIEMWNNVSPVACFRPDRNGWKRSFLTTTPCNPGRDCRHPAASPPDFIVIHKGRERNEKKRMYS
jgi:hypothetical protein